MGKTTTKKMHGQKSFGYGSKKKHRGHGSKGGCGLAGSKKHNKFKVWKEMPEHFVHINLKKKSEGAVINIKDLGSFKETRINLKEAGYTKLLGNGETTKKLEIIVNKWSKQAEEKIKKAGGKIESGRKVKEDAIKNNKEFKPEDKEDKKDKPVKDVKSKEDKKDKPAKETKNPKTKENTK
ncbi:MAG: hypothetical protein DRP06_00345 [Candidatus Aenigmatarchaeota archaeon]|nr:MAG: hypothetical protein DRP06_00345 [Candidatus Aenigmarchaeota archaeon]